MIDYATDERRIWIGSPLIDCEAGAAQEARLREARAYLRCAGIYRGDVDCRHRYTRSDGMRMIHTTARYTTL